MIITVNFEKYGRYFGSEYHYRWGAGLAPEIGEVILVPARDTKAKARVIRVDVCESEVAKFADKVRTITHYEPVEEQKKAENQEQETEAKAFVDPL